MRFFVEFVLYEGINLEVNLCFFLVRILFCLSAVLSGLSNCFHANIYNL